MKKILTIIALAGAAACATSGGSGLTTITSTPEGATVRIDGFSDCETPCAIRLEFPADVTVAKAGYTAERFRINPGEKSVSVDLELAAPTEGVEETELPEL